MDIWEQPGYDVRLEWGAEGIENLGPGCTALVIVDVLSFSTTTDIVLGRGSRVLPLRWRDEQGVARARAAGADLAGEGARTLRPSTVTEIPSDTLLALPSPNGATLCDKASTAGAAVLVGCLRNAYAVAERAHELSRGGPIGVIAAGERWGVSLFGDNDGELGPLRPCVEDQLGAGAIVAALTAYDRVPSPEAALAATAYGGTDVLRALHACTSGREHGAAGHEVNITLAAQVDVSMVAPVLSEGILSS
ncbi:2-phosphosulfolactate phosphatase [Amycolatopsis samaneae]|uniref:Probable 2-phosphosulfolactate phosphatase n=1 Tax=Amycolatopsis samaneae TaxID=664691 RepID=A0ABW5GTZ6_9PSEU